MAPRFDLFLANGFDAGTGDTLGDGGMLGDGGGGGLAWQQLAFIDAGAGTALTDPVPLPVYLTDGGYGHRLVWVANAGIFAADDSSGSFDAPQPVPGNPPSPGTLIGALTPNLGNLAWANAQNNVEAAYSSPSGGRPPRSPTASRRRSGPEIGHRLRGRIAELRCGYLRALDRLAPCRSSSPATTRRSSRSIRRLSSRMEAPPRFPLPRSGTAARPRQPS